MELVEGVYLHFIESQKFKTQRIKIRFSAPLEEKTLAGRAMIAYLLESANKIYPSARLFRTKLASLYGASFETSLSKKGGVHIVDIDISFLSPTYLEGKDLSKELMEFLKHCLWNPLTQGDRFDPDYFQLEKENLKNNLESETEDNFYQAYLAINRLFFQSTVYSLPKQGTLSLVEKENPESTFRVFQKMLSQDRIDIFLLGQFNEKEMIAIVKEFPLQPRQPDLHFQIDQSFSKIMPKIIEKKKATQSILELAYHISAPYNSQEFFTAIVLNGILGGFSHSRLFTVIREEEGLSYSIGSQLDPLTSCLSIYAGIAKENRHKVMSLINQQLLKIKQGQFSQTELKETKMAIKHNFKLSQDRQLHLIEQTYMQVVLDNCQFTVDNWLTIIDKVTKEDVVQMARKVKLQALYFLEANDDNR